MMEAKLGTTAPMEAKLRGNSTGFNPRGITFCVVAHRVILCALAIALLLSLIHI